MLAVLLYHVVIGGAERAQIELTDDPLPDAVLETPEGHVVRVYDVVPGPDGSRVIMASWEGPSHDIAR